MRCKFCGFGNGEDDHRCLRCGRRLAGVVIAAPSDYVGSAALSLHRHEDVAVYRDVLQNDASELPVAESAEPKRQAALFSTLQTAPKVIPFEQAQRHATARAGFHEPIAAARVAGYPHSPVPGHCRSRSHGSTPARLAGVSATCFGRCPGHARFHHCSGFQSANTEDERRSPGVLRSAGRNADASLCRRSD